MDIEGFMRNAKFPRDYRRMFKHDDGRPMTPDEARSQLFAELRQGRRVIPMGDCDNFDYQTGCKGHPATPIVDRLVTVENDPTVPAYARKVAADAVRAMGGADADPT